MRTTRRRAKVPTRATRASGETERGLVVPGGGGARRGRGCFEGRLRRRARVAANLGVRVGANGGAASRKGHAWRCVRRDGRARSRRGGVETNAASRAPPIAAPTFAVAREFYGKDWSPVSALTTSHGPDDVDAVTGVGLFDVQYGRNLELTWSMLEAARAVERAAATIGGESPFADAVNPPRLETAALASVNAYAWRFGTREGGRSCGGAGGLWRGVRDFDGDAVDDYSKGGARPRARRVVVEFESATAGSTNGSSSAIARRGGNSSTRWRSCTGTSWTGRWSPGSGSARPRSSAPACGASSPTRRRRRNNRRQNRSRRSGRRSKDPFRGFAGSELRNVLRRGVDPVNAH